MRVACKICGAVYEHSQQHRCPTNPPLTSKPIPKKALTGAERAQKYRSAHAQGYRDYMRNYMQRYRSKK